jgi:hypothetical protein
LTSFAAEFKNLKIKKLFMKKLLLIAILIASVGAVQAQDKKTGFRVGLMLGANANMWAGDDKDILGEPESRISWHGGLLFQMPLSANLAFTPGLKYKNLGPKFSEEGVDAKISMNYLMVPLSLQYFFGGVSAGGFFAQLSPIAAIQMGNGKIKYEYDGEEEEEEFEDDTFNSFQFMLGVGLGYQMASGFGFSANYDLGLSQLFNDDDGEEVKIKNTAFQLSLFYMLGGGKK